MRQGRPPWRLPLPGDAGRSLRPPEEGWATVLALLLLALITIIDPVWYRR